MRREHRRKRDRDRRALRQLNDEINASATARKTAFEQIRVGLLIDPATGTTLDLPSIASSHKLKVVFQPFRIEVGDSSDDPPFPRHVNVIQCFLMEVASRHYVSDPVTSP